MPHYKDSQNNVHHLDNASFASAFLPPDCVEITDKEAAILQAEYLANMPKPDPILMRAAAYQAESDPLFFKYQRGEATKEEWLAKIEEIKSAFPKE